MNGGGGISSWGILWYGDGDGIDACDQEYGGGGDVVGAFVIDNNGNVGNGRLDVLQVRG